MSKSLQLLSIRSQMRTRVRLIMVKNLEMTTIRFPARILAHRKPVLSEWSADVAIQQKWGAGPRKGSRNDSGWGYGPQSQDPDHLRILALSWADITSLNVLWLVWSLSATHPALCQQPPGLQLCSRLEVNPLTIKHSNICFPPWEVSKQ